MMFNFHRLWRYSLIILALTLPATLIYANQSEDDDYGDYYIGESQYRVLHDPLERINRYIFAFNMRIDQILLRPVAYWYCNVVPHNARNAVDNLLSTASLPATMVNNLLQLKFDDALKTFWQFTINMVLGVGVHDVAQKVGLHVPNQTIGNTLARYGIGPGVYIVLPLIGSTNTRDISGIIIGERTNPLWHYVSLNKAVKGAKATLFVINKRAQILEFTDSLASHPGDLYITVRSMYHQHRERSVNYPQQAIKK